MKAACPNLFSLTLAFSSLLRREPKDNFVITSLLHLRRQHKILTLLLIFASLPFSIYGQVSGPWTATATAGEDGYELWLRYRHIEDPQLLARYQKAIPSASVLGASSTTSAIKDELNLSLPVILGQKIPLSSNTTVDSGLVIGTWDKLQNLAYPMTSAEREKLGTDGFIIRWIQEKGRPRLIVSGNTDRALLYGTFYLIRQLQMHRDITKLDVTSIPRIRYRLLNHWDNLNGRIERGYAGGSLWNWNELPQTIDPRYRDYARACASIGINGAVLNNVNAQVESLDHDHLVKTAALAAEFRPYGIRVLLVPKFSAPILLGKLSTADPRSPEVLAWWKQKVDEIYKLIPDFGGFLVKANSEGQPGPQTYGATHVDGANMFANLLHPHGGIVLWRAFVYGNSNTINQVTERANAAYMQFHPLDGQFADNVVIQIKNGPLDFQPREPFNPLFGAMPKSHEGMECEITQEYLGQSAHLVYLAPLWKATLDSDTYVIGPGSTVGKVIDGSLDHQDLSLMSGIANTGNNRNWCGHPFAQANWYAFGRLAWDHELSAETIADEWIRCTWSNDPDVVASIKQIMLSSWETCVSYMTPLGLAFLNNNNRNGPQPGLVMEGNRANWLTQYYHRMDAQGIGFDRSSSGTKGTALYHEPLGSQLDHLASCPEKYLLWFHHIPWNYRMASGRTLLDELDFDYAKGIAECQTLRDEWKALQGKVDEKRYKDVLNRLDQQVQSAQLWRKTCMDAFKSTAGSKEKIPGKEIPVPDLGASPESPIFKASEMKPLQ